MLRIRFHGRGGQGMKTASRIAGTAAFRQGYYAQDSPVYGAERRGAPMVAFTRFDPNPILERGIVASPDLVVIADASLIDDPLVRPLNGLTERGIVLLNSPRADKAGSRMAARDFTNLALAHAGSTSALSVALGAAAAKLAGLELEFIEQAVSEELQELNLDAARIQQNLALARAASDWCVSAALPPPEAVLFYKGDTEPPGSARVVIPTYEGPWAGTASVCSPANTPQRKTGDWRVMRPVIDVDRCTHCWICFITCPDGAINLDTADLPRIDYGVCKGCLMCMEECPIDAIAATREGVASEVVG